MGKFYKYPDGTTLTGEEKLVIYQENDTKSIELNRILDDFDLRDPTTTLVDLTDTDIISPDTGHALIYNNNTEMWENGEVASTLVDLTDTVVEDPQDGNVLAYLEGEWVNNKLFDCVDGGGGRGVFTGGYADGDSFKSIDYITISTPSNATDFGDLTDTREEMGTTSNGANDRAVAGGGYGDIISIEYFTISTPSNAIYFGDLGEGIDSLAATSNGTNERGVFAGGDNGDYSDVIEYITISTPANAIDFGDLVGAREDLSATSNDTNERGVFAGGYGDYDGIDYITISTLGNATIFGDLTENREYLAATSNGTNDRGVFGGGYDTDVIDYITISTPSNATDFGDLPEETDDLASTSNLTNERGIFAGGDGEYDYISSIRYITISTPSNATDFGDLTSNKAYFSGTSNGAEIPNGFCIKTKNPFDQDLNTTDDVHFHGVDVDSQEVKFTTTPSTFEFVGVKQHINDDDGYGEIDIPFAFNFYGITYTKMYVTTNGYIMFEEWLTDDRPPIDELGDGPFIAVCGGDLKTNLLDDTIDITNGGTGYAAGGSQVYTGVVGTNDMRDGTLTADITVTNGVVTEVDISYSPILTGDWRYGDTVTFDDADLGGGTGFQSIAYQLIALDIYIEDNGTNIVVRWNAREYYPGNGDEEESFMNFSCTLYNNGSITFKYGDFLDDETYYSMAVGINNGIDSFMPFPGLDDEYITGNDLDQNLEVNDYLAGFYNDGTLVSKVNFNGELVDDNGNPFNSIENSSDTTITDTAAGNGLIYYGGEWINHKLFDFVFPMGGRGVFAGGYNKLNIIDYITISSPSTATDFGDLVIGRYTAAGTSNGINDRGVFAGGYTDSDNTEIDYITISTPGNATDFGDLTIGRSHVTGTSNGINDRGVFAGGVCSELEVIDYITISTPGNATDFGDLTVDRYQLSATSNDTNERGVFAGGNGPYRVIDYITISTPGNATDFGDLTQQRKLLAATSNGTNERGVFGGGYNGNVKVDIIDYITISTTSNATDFGDLNNKVSSLAGTSNGTTDRGVFAGGSADDYLSAIDYITISSPSNATNWGNLTDDRNGLVGTSNGQETAPGYLELGVSTLSDTTIDTPTNGEVLTYLEGDWINNELFDYTAPGGGRGVFAGGTDGDNIDTIDYITISTPGNATDFGDLTVARYHLKGTSNGTNDRGVFGGGTVSGDTIDYITISTPGNATDFGDLTVARSTPSATSNGINDRGVFAGGYSGGTLNVIDYITISTSSNATDFGDLTIARSEMGANSNGTNDRGVFAGGWDDADYDTIDYITISTPNNAIDFGNLLVGVTDLSGTSNGTNDRGIFAGGSSYTNVIDYITISTPSNSINFGTLTVGRNGMGSTSNGVGERGVFGGGRDSSQEVNIIDYITISTPGNATDFGDLTGYERRRLAATSNGNVTTSNFKVKDHLTYDQDLNTFNTPTFKGMESLSKSDESTNSIMIIGGNETMTGIGNICIGDGTGLSTTTGVYNTFVGDGAGAANITGNSNTFVGSGAGADNTGNSNVAIGSGAGEDTEGDSNVSIGRLAGNEMIGDNNVCIGDYTCANNGGEICNENVFIGSSVATYCYTGSNNVCIGNYTGYDIQDGFYNVYIGESAGYGSDPHEASYNVAIGYEAGRRIATGEYNVFMGYQAGENVTTGSNLICIGKNAQPSAVDAAHQMIVGDAIDIISVGLGGQDNPQEILDVTGNGLFSGTITGGEPWTIHTTTTANEGITAIVNNKYMVDTTASTANIVITMPTADLGDTITVTDMSGNFSVGGTNNVVTDTITFEGASTTFEFDVVNKTETLMFVDLTYGWKQIV